MLDPEPINVTWEELDRLVGELAEKVGSIRPRAGDHARRARAGRDPGLSPGPARNSRRRRRVLHQRGEAHDAPRFGHFPDTALLRDRRILVVDEVWETGETMAAVFSGSAPPAGGRSAP